MSNTWMADLTERTWAPVEGETVARNTLTMKSGDKATLGMDFGDMPELIAGATIINATITTNTGATITNEAAANGYVATALFDLAGCAATDVGVATFAVTLDSGVILTRTGTLVIQ